MSNALLSEIKDFLARTGMGPSYFGDVACGNTELVRRLENGGSVTLRTAEKIRSFIAQRSGQENIKHLECVESAAVKS
jgi:hypothetical protein